MRPALADGARSALARMRRQAQSGRPFRLALLDHMMPETDGFGLAAKAAVEAALKLETMGREGNWTGVEEAWTALEIELQRLLPALTASVKDGP